MTEVEQLSQKVADLEAALKSQKRASRKMIARCQEEIDDARKLVEVATGKSFDAVVADHSELLEGEDG